MYRVRKKVTVHLFTINFYLSYRFTSRNLTWANNSAHTSSPRFLFNPNQTKAHAGFRFDYCSVILFKTLIVVCLHLMQVKQAYAPLDVTVEVNGLRSVHTPWCGPWSSHKSWSFIWDSKQSHRVVTTAQINSNFPYGCLCTREDIFAAYYLLLHFGTLHSV